MHTQNPYAIYFVAIFVMVFVAAISWNRPRQIIEHWAEQNGFKVIRARQAFFYKGPFTFSYSKGQPVYRVTIEDQNGLPRSGWLRCGSWMMGVFSDVADMRWDGDN